jgi:hypothetical protein
MLGKLAQRAIEEMARSGKKRGSHAFSCQTPTARQIEKMASCGWRSGKTLIFALWAELWRAVVAAGNSVRYSAEGRGIEQERTEKTGSASGVPVSKSLNTG